jgi:hypothetical protein
MKEREEYQGMRLNLCISKQIIFKKFFTLPKIILITIPT